MKAISISSFGGPETLKLVEREDPVPGDGQVLIRVKAAGVNFVDVLQRKGKYPAPAGVVADIPGLEISGMVDSVGEKWKPGDKVCALIAGGGYASMVVVDERHCLPVPPGMSFEEAASLPECIFTVWLNVFQLGRLRAGETFLVHGGTSGIGSFAIPLSKIFGAKVYATAGTEEKCRTCESWGATACFNYKKQDFAEELKPIGVDVILDMVGGDYIEKNLSILKPDGRLVFINAMKGSSGKFNVLDLMQRRLTITGSTLRSRPADFKAALASEVEKNVWPYLNDGKLSPYIFKTFPLAEARLAHELIETSSHIGKVVLTVDG